MLWRNAERRSPCHFLAGVSGEAERLVAYWEVCYAFQRGKRTMEVLHAGAEHFAGRVARQPSRRRSDENQVSALDKKMKQWLWLGVKNVWKSSRDEPTHLISSQKNTGHSKDQKAVLTWAAWSRLLSFLEKTQTYTHQWIHLPFKWGSKSRCKWSLASQKPHLNTPRECIAAPRCVEVTQLRPMQRDKWGNCDNHCQRWICPKPLFYY